MIVTIAEHSLSTDLLSLHPVIVDLGCCRGSFLDSFVQTFPQFARYLGIEANPDLITALQTKIADQRIEILHGIIGRSSAPSAEFYVDTVHDLNSSSIWRNTNANLWKTVHVPRISFRSLITSLGFTDLVKMDIEGSEWEILGDWDKTLAETVPQVSVEFHDFVDPSRRADTEHCIAHMKNFGYSVISSGTEWGHGSQYYNVLFLSNKYSPPPVAL